ncbi:SUMF1/EgtB/PvdO family nonheme iron enzyme [Campylobacterota bacterium]
MRYLFSFLLLFSFLDAAQVSLATMKKENRVAFIIGNGEYDEAPIDSAVDDAMKMKNFLEKQNFHVTYIEDASKREIIKGLRTFNSNMKQDGIALFYFVGHAVQVRNKNYLIPVEASIESDHHVLYEAIELNAILSKMRSAGNRLNIVMLDSSHKNPFGDRYRAKEKGLAKLRKERNLDVITSTAPNRMTEPYPFTSKLLSVISAKGISNKEGFKEFKKRYPQSFNQTSQESFYFNLPSKLISQEDKVWKKTIALGSISAYTAYLAKNPNTKYKKEANEKLVKLINDEKEKKAQEQNALEEQLKKIKKSDQEKAKKAAELKAQEKAEAEAVQAEAEAVQVAAAAHEEQQRSDAEDIAYVDPMMLLIKAGTVSTGTKNITIKKDFYIGHYEVSNAEYNEYLKYIDSLEFYDEKWAKNPFQPAVNVSWEDANGYAKWLSKLTGEKYRLPTQTEWEYVARAGASTKYFWGDRDTSHRKDSWRKEYPDNAHNFAWIKSNAQNITHTVGSKSPNNWGVYDILGNAAEWCSDKASDNKRVIRGGSWSSSPEEITLTSRDEQNMNFASSKVGFRLVREK